MMGHSFVSHRVMPFKRSLTFKNLLWKLPYLFVTFFVKRTGHKIKICFTWYDLLTSNGSLKINRDDTSLR